MVGPTGLAFDVRSDTLYVASTADNAIYAIPQAAVRRSDKGTGTIIYQDNTHLHGPLALALAPNGNLLTTNGDAVNPGGTPNAIVEFTPKGQFIAQDSGGYQLSASARGAAFGLALTRSGGSLLLAAVDDNTNQVKVWKITSPD